MHHKSSEHHVPKAAPPGKLDDGHISSPTGGNGVRYSGGGVDVVDDVIVAVLGCGDGGCRSGNG